MGVVRLHSCRFAQVYDKILRCCQRGRLGGAAESVLKDMIEIMDSESSFGSAIPSAAAAASRSLTSSARGSDARVMAAQGSEEGEGLRGHAEAGEGVQDFTPEPMIVEVRHFNMALSAYARAGQWQEAHRMLGDARLLFRVEPDEISFTTVIHSCVSAKPEAQYDLALDLVDSLRDTGTAVDDLAIYRLSITAASRKGDWQRALDELNQVACTTPHNRTLTRPVARLFMDVNAHL